jgi:hypothetical protein
VGRNTSSGRNHVVYIGEFKMIIIAISGSGIGAGKTTLAKRFDVPVWSLAGALRMELKKLYPDYDWFNKSQSYKDGTVVRQTDKTIRTMLIEHGQLRCNGDILYWVRNLADKIELNNSMLSAAVIIPIDDIRKVCEIEYLKDRFKGRVMHYHIANNAAIPEKEFENNELAEVADYVLHWNGYGKK